MSTFPIPKINIRPAKIIVYNTTQKKLIGFLIYCHPGYDSNLLYNMDSYHLDNKNEQKRKKII